MKVEKLDRVVVYVPNIKKAKKFWGELFDTEFTDIKATQSSGVTNLAAFSPFGFELVQRVSPALDICGIQGFHLKVKDLTKAVGEMKERGFNPDSMVRIKGLHEAIFTVRGIRFILVEYKGKNFGLG